MVIWNWLLAKAFSYYNENNNIVIFASWVSNSQNQDIALFKREIELLKKTLNENQNKLIVYFSTCSITDESLKSSKYINHKKHIEKIIKNHQNNDFLILRISNPVWYTQNNHTLLNYIAEKINNNEKFTVYKNSKRNIIDIEDLFIIAKYIIDNRLFINEVINISNNMNIDILEIVNLLEKAIWKKAIYDIEEKGWTPIIDTKNIQNIINKLNINFDYSYLEKVIYKYYS